jgi:hypothetical protein
VHPPSLAPHLAALLREQGYEAFNNGRRLWRLVVGGIIAAWRREHPDARVGPPPNRQLERCGATSAAATPSPIKTVPPNQRWMRAISGVPRRRSATVPATAA